MLVSCSKQTGWRSNSSLYFPRYYWTIIGYLPKHNFQEIDFLPGHTVFGERYFFSIIDEAAQGLGLSLLSAFGAIGEKGSKIAVE